MGTAIAIPRLAIDSEDSRHRVSGDAVEAEGADYQNSQDYLQTNCGRSDHQPTAAWFSARSAARGNR